MTKGINEMVGSAYSALNIEPGKRPTRLSFMMALANLEEVCQEIQNLDDLYCKRRKDLLAERDDMIRDAAESRVSVRQLQHVTSLSRNRIYQIRAAGSDD